MPETAHDLLVDPVFRIRLSGDGESALSLPGVLSRLGGDELESFRGLQLHQEHAWHAFLVQLAAIALHRVGRSESTQGEPTWREMLLALTDGGAAPWCLVVPELARPAFMQPPVPETTLEGWEVVEFPDALDVLVTAKNHDVKANRILRPRPEHWAYALVSLQTMQGYSGRDNYGIARMNGGFASRPSVGYAPALGWGPRFRRDTTILLTHRGELLDRYPASGGKTLLWLEPWDGRTSLSLDTCDPYFIEVCRRVRLTADGERLLACATSSKTARLAAKDVKGNTGDPWTPVEVEEGKALTVGGGGFSYRLMQELLFGSTYRPGLTQRLDDRDGPSPLIVARVLARGQGKTEGMHSRVLPIPPKVRRFLTRPDAREHLARLAGKRVQRAGDAQRKLLRPALRALLQAGSNTPNLDDDRPERWLKRFDANVDAIFFERLWEDVELEPEEASRRWAKELRNLAQRQLDDAIRSAPLPEARRYRAIAAAEREFARALYRHFPEVLQQPVQEPHEP